MKAVRTASTTYSHLLPYLTAGLLFVFASFGFSARAAGSGDYYLVQKSDTLTTILYSLGLSPMWGPHGSVKKIIAHNDFIRAREKGGDLIFPGEKIQIPDGLQPKVERNITLGFVTRNDEGRVDFNCGEEGLAAWSLHLKSKFPSKDPFDPRSRTLALRCDRTQTLAETPTEISVEDSQTETTVEDANEPVMATAKTEVITECLEDCPAPEAPLTLQAAIHPGEENLVPNELPEVADKPEEISNNADPEEASESLDVTEVRIDDVIEELDEREPVSERPSPPVRSIEEPVRSAASEEASVCCCVS